MWKPMNVLGLLFATLVLTAACGDDGDEEQQKEEDLEPTPEPEEPEPTVEVMPSIGGTMLAVGSHHVEVVPATDGYVEATVRNAQGEPVTGSGATVEATVQVTKTGETTEAGGEADKPEGSAGGQRGGKATTGGTSTDHKAAPAPSGDKDTTGEAARGSKPLPRKPDGQRKGQQGTEDDKPGAGSNTGGSKAGDKPSKGAGSKAGAADQDRAGAAAQGQGSAGAEAEAQAEGEVTTKTVKLAWDEGLQRYRAKLEEGLKIVPGEIAVALDVEGNKDKATAPRVAVAPPSRHGGVVLLAGSVAAEVRTSADGEIRAYVEDEDAEEEAEEQEDDDAPLQGALVVRVQTDAGKQRAVPLHWSAEHGLYVGKLRGAKMTSGAIELVHQIGGNEHRGRIDEVAAPKGPKHGGYVVVAGDHTVELKAGGKGKLHAFVQDASGKPVQGKGKATLRADVMVDGSRTPVELSWNADAKRYEAKVEGKVRLSAAPVEVTLTRDGRKRRGRLARGLAFAQQRAAVDLSAVIEAHAAAQPVPGAGALGKGKGKAKGAGAAVKARGAAAGAAKARKQGEAAAGRVKKAGGSVKKQAGGSAGVRVRGGGGGGGDDDEGGSNKKGVKVRAGGSAGVDIGGD